MPLSRDFATSRVQGILANPALVPHEIADRVRGRGHGHAHPIRDYSATTAAFVHSGPQPSHLKVCLVGHSRGGLIAAMVAEMLEPLHVPVDLLCLYDAVDRYSWSGTDVVRNVRRTFHARRDPAVGSRVSFGNTASDSRTLHGYVEKLFRTSHGGIGGSPDFQPTEIMQDYSCAGVEEHVMEILGQESEMDCVTEMHAADAWIRARARGEGLGFKTRA